MVAWVVRAVCASLHNFHTKCKWDESRSQTAAAHHRRQRAGCLELENNSKENGKHTILICDMTVRSSKSGAVYGIVVVGESCWWVGSYRDFGRESIDNWQFNRSQSLWQTLSAFCRCTAPVISQRGGSWSAWANQILLGQRKVARAATHTSTAHCPLHTAWALPFNNFHCSGFSCSLPPLVLSTIELPEKKKKVPSHRRSRRSTRYVCSHRQDGVICSRNALQEARGKQSDAANRSRCRGCWRQIGVNLPGSFSHPQRSWWPLIRFLLQY